MLNPSYGAITTNELYCLRGTEGGTSGGGDGSRSGSSSPPSLRWEAVRVSPAWMKPSPRAFHSAVAVGPRLIIMGGEVGDAHHVQPVRVVICRRVVALLLI